MRIAWFVHGRGKGHSVRTLSALPRLSRHDLHLFGGGEAARSLAHRPELVPITPCLPGPGMLAAFAGRVRDDRARLVRLRPSVVVSDGDGPSVHAARSLGLPVVAMSHGLVFGHAHLPRGLPRSWLVRERLNAASSSLGAERRIAVHFAPLEPRTEGTIVARPDPRPDLVRRASEGTIVVYLRDGGGEAWLERVAGLGRPIVVFGRLARPVAGVRALAPSVEGFADALASAAGVLATAGNHLPAECAELGIPLLALHARRDAEQGMNARMIEAAGLGVRGVLECPDAAPLARYEARLARGRIPLASLASMPTVSDALERTLADLEPTMRR